MLKIKLSPTGKKHDIHYRVVVMEENSKITGRFIASLGHYHPDSKKLTVDHNLLKSWVKKGAQPTNSLRKLWKNF
ncbi:30S ribosomal protein S16 [Candidatus Amesbacteria bacterium RIFCSPHIGHO2_01_FULL_48_32]|uniref:Small ribosomal subunit protein bS16 n=1 Tax=Candidatus Amesbacteria bacterium RIFCSPLOWO2_01_FULL_48_25 TaxID=1797259 RepID=A0A1F4ZC20_9BACT|nr:MAG: 30S ribosomal protein S16 [Candidatus Amesbacteria bacterium RIFCSPHIGHO2_01_FULL_48_32]OGD03771.1 MAG: 30S ribosomal protein S16 [Candidatus Amesbacteria bacterium RIFCSPLOWO2_01_FULL_48_25]HJZ05123.1 30S ribosomal protein S16 [Patescibacteria group bacterium]